MISLAFAMCISYKVPMAIHESGQMYLETIYILSQNSTFVRAIDV